MRVRESGRAYWTVVLGRGKGGKETLGRVQAQLADADKAREGSYRAVATQLSSVVTGQQELHAATEGLTRSLRSSNVRGKWGEVQLRRIVELAGMIERCDFYEKESTTTDAGARQTPDLIVRLPGEATVVIDAKVAMDGFLAASNATTDAERQMHLECESRLRSADVGRHRGLVLAEHRIPIAERT